MRGAVRGVNPLRSIRMRERAYNFTTKEIIITIYFSAHFRVGQGARTALY
jgi:hypothetical protein